MVSRGKGKGKESLAQRSLPLRPPPETWGTPPYTVTALRFPALAGRQSCRFLESGPLHPPQAALGPLSPRTPLKRHKGRGPRPPHLESAPRGWTGLRGSKRPPRIAMQTQNSPTGCAGGVPCRTASPHLEAGHSSGCKEDALCFSFRWRWMDKRKRRAEALLLKFAIAVPGPKF